MAANPALAHRGIGTTSIPVGLITFDGARLAARGVFTRKPLTGGTAADALALTGISAWFGLPFAYDEKSIQWVVPDVTGNGLVRSQAYRVIRAQRIHGAQRWDTVEAILADDPQPVPDGGDFDPADFDPADFFTGVSA